MGSNADLDYFIGNTPPNSDTVHMHSDRSTYVLFVLNQIDQIGLNARPRGIG